MIAMIYTALKNDLDDGWYPRVIGVYDREDPFIVTDVDLYPEDEEFTVLIGTYANDGTRREISIYTDSFALDPIYRENLRAYRLVPNKPKTETRRASDIIEEWGKRTANGEYFNIEIKIAGNKTFRAHDYYWDGSGDWVVLKGHYDLTNKHYIYMPGSATIRQYIDEGVYVVELDQIFVH